MEALLRRPTAMAAKVLCLLGVLIVQVSCGQNSLTFVIDDTGSMYDDIKQVKNAAKSIVDIVLNEKQSQIEDIVLVTFNDPDTKLRKKTRDAIGLKQALESINVGGGGDCPEMSLSGIKKGLEESRPGSYVYVFTDASSKDHGMYAEVKTLCQKKQSQVVFVLTGDCSDRTRESYKVYHKIAANCSGQVFNISKIEVSKVLEYVKETIKGDRNVIVQTVIPADTWRDIKFNIDDQTEYAIVSAAGRGVALHVVIPRTYTVASVRITWIDNLKVLKLANLSPGTYTAKVRGNSEVNIMVFGRTDFTFQHGFSSVVRTSVKGIYPQPTTGVKTHLMVSVQDKANSANIREVELLDMNDRVVMKLPLTRVAADVYKTDKFLSPQHTFKISVVATSNNTGKRVTRVAKTPVTPIQSVAPEIRKTDKHVKVKTGGSVYLHCRMNKGEPMPQITWSVKKEGAIGFTPLGDTHDVIHVTNVLTNDHYKCDAKNVAGHDEHTVQLDVPALPKFPNNHITITKMEGEPTTIDCKLHKGNPRPKISWQYKPSDAASYKSMGHEGDVLKIGTTQLSHSGHYRCVAQNNVGRDEKITELVIKAKPAAEKLSPVQSVMENTIVNFNCRATKGFPKPNVNWFYKGPHSTKYESKHTDHIRIGNVQLSDAGQYMCVAENEVGRHEQVVQLVVKALPKFPNNHNTITKMEGEPTTIDCKLHKGNPRPKISWQYKPSDAASYKSMEHEGDVLNIETTQLSHSGHYRCVAQNNVGRDEKITELVVKAKPAAEKLSPVQSVMENTIVNFNCRATKGFPKPNVNWFYKGPHSTKYESKHTDHIRIGNVQLSDAGQYMCVAENEVGRHEQVVQLVVKALPKFPNNHNTITKMEGEPTTIDCKLHKGNPRPKISWQYKPSDAASYKSMEHEGDVLNIETTQLSHSGHYRCVAQNNVGRDEKITELVVKAKPAAEKLSPVQSVMENTIVNFNCRATKGFPKPNVNWFYKGPHSTKYESKHTDHIRIGNVQLSDAGQYMCVAENEVGRHEQVVQLVVNAPPRIVFEPPNSAEYTGVEGDAAARLHCTAVGHPTPNITWKVDERVVGTDKSKELYVEGNALLLLHPKNADSINKSHSFVCHAANEYGEAAQPYTVFISEYIDLEEPNATQYSLIGQPFDVLCPLPFKDPSSVRWYRYYNEFNETGPTLHIVNGNDSHSGNYTCRVSDLTGRPISQTIEVIFDRPPKKAITFSNIEWTGKENALDLNLDEHPIHEVKHEWFYNGNKIDGAHSNSFKTSDWGEYTCRVSNALGSLTITWKIASDKVCGITKSLLKKNNAPLILDSSLSWPALSTLAQYVMVPHSEKLHFICPDVNNVTNVSTNDVAKFPTLKSVYATCDHEDSFLVDGVSRKISELDCKHSVTPSVVATGKPCLGENTELMKVGFHVNGFTDVYHSCIDKIKNVPLYTKMNTIPVEGRDDSSRSGVKTAKQLCLDDCCYENIQLVNATDVSFGPPEKATFMDSLNSVKYCKPKNGTNWHEIEEKGRVSVQLTVWSGAAQYKKIDAAWIPKYLWKVMKEMDTSERVVIVYENVATPSSKMCSGSCGVEYTWIELSGDRTYCCSLADFKTAFGVNVDFDES